MIQFYVRGFYLGAPKPRRQWSPLRPKNAGAARRQQTRENRLAIDMNLPIEDCQILTSCSIMNVKSADIVVFLIVTGPVVQKPVSLTVG